MVSQSGRGAAWLARLLGVQEVPSSNLGGPTNFLNPSFGAARYRALPHLVTGIPATAQFVVGWPVSGAGIPSGTTIKSVDSSSQVTLSAAVSAGYSGVALQFGGTFSKPTAIFDFDPVANTISPVSPALNDNALNTAGYTKMMLMLPTGQVLFFDSSNFYVYTPDGAAPTALQPAITSIAPNKTGGFTLTGTQLNGQSAGAAYGDDEQNDTSFPIISLTDSSGNVFYSRATNWSYIGVAGGSTPETVDFTLDSRTVPGSYSLIESGAGTASAPITVDLGSDLTFRRIGAGGEAYHAPVTVDAVGPDITGKIFGAALVKEKAIECNRMPTI